MQFTAAAFLATFLSAPICGQQIAFTSRAHLQCPMIVASTQESKVYGFESVLLQSDSANPVRAVRLKVTFRTRAGEEITDERRFVVDMEPRDKKRVVVDLGHIEGLKQKARSRELESGLAILNIAAVEFEDGTLWEDDGPVQGIPVLDPKLERK